MAYDDVWVPDLDDEEDEEQEGEYNNYSDSCIFMIESSASMLAAPGEVQTGGTQPFMPTQTQAPKERGKGKGKAKEESSLLMGLKAAFQLMRKKIISSPKDHVGIIVYNTAEGSEVEVKWENCIVVQDLVQVDAQHIKQLRLLIEECERDPSELYKRFRPREEGQNALEEALRVCINRFKSKSPKLAIKRALILSDNDCPYPLGGEGDRYRQVTASRVKDKQEMGVRFEQFFIERPQSGRKFDVRKFWQPLLEAHEGSPVEEAINDAPPHVKDVTELIQELIQTASTRESTKRALFSIPFQIGSGLEIGIQGYVLVTEEKRKAYTWFDPNTRGGEEVQVVTEFAIMDSTNKVEKSEIVKYYPIGDVKKPQKMRRVVFTPEEQVKARTLGRKPGLTLLGFKPRDELPWQQHLKHAYFIHPNEDAYVGSNRTFAALLQAMQKKDKIGLGVFLPRKNSTPQLVAILPQLEAYDELGVQETPSGMHLCQMPWADEIRPSHVDSTLGIVQEDEDENEAIEHAKRIVKLLKKGYLPNNYPNPALNHHYDCLAAIALKEDLPEPNDKTTPAYAVIQDRCGKAIADFQNSVGRHPRANEQFGDAPKVSNKKRKVEDGEGVDEEAVLQAFRQGTEKKLVVKQLKDYLIYTKVLRTSSKAPPKAELLEMTRKHLKKEGIVGGSDSE